MLMDSGMLGNASHSPYSKRNIFWGCIIFLLALIFLLGFLFAAVLSKTFPPFENRFLYAIQNDRYYCLLVPLTLPVLVVAVYMHWLSMKLFKHA